MGARVPADLDRVLRDEPTTWTARRTPRLTPAYAVIAVVGVAIALLFATNADGWSDTATGDRLALVLLPAALAVGGALGAAQGATWRATVDGAGVLTAGGIVRRRRVDLTDLASVVLRPEAGKTEPTDTVRLVVTDRAGGRAVLDPDADPSSWRAWHAVVWHAVDRGVPLGIAARLVAARSDAPTLRALLEVPSPPVAGAVELRRGVRRTGRALHVNGWLAFVLLYASTLGDGPGDWPWWRWLVAAAGVAFAARVLWLVVVVSRRRLTVDAAGQLRAGGDRVDLAALVAAEQLRLSDTDGPSYARLAGVELDERLDVLFGEPGSGGLRVRDDDGRFLLASPDEWEPGAVLASRVLHAIDERGIEVSAHLRYDLRAAAGQVPLGEHLDTVERTTGVRPRPERHATAG